MVQGLLAACSRGEEALKRSKNPATTSAMLRPRPVSIETVAVTPARKGGSFAWGSRRMRTGRGCTTFTQLPEAFCGGRIANSAPVAGLMVDEAHAVGVVGARGHRVHEHCGIDPNAVVIWMGMLSKTLSGCGGYIVGNARLIEWLCHSTPGLAAAAKESPKILQAVPQGVARRQPNAALFLQLARAAGSVAGSATPHAINPGHPGVFNCRGALFAKAL
jgi:hypothetical protein